MAAPDWLAPLTVQGGTVSVLAVFCWRLVRSLIKQLNDNADRAWRAVEASDKRADEMVRLNAEMVAAMRGVEDLVRALSRKDVA